MSIWPAALFAIILLLFGGGTKSAEDHLASATELSAAKMHSR